MKREEMRQRIAELEQQNRFLQANMAAMASGAIAPTTAADLARTRPDLNSALPQSVRDEAAVGALIRSRYHVIHSLREMGYPVDAMPWNETMDLARELFDNDRVRALLQESLRPLEEKKEQLIAQQTQDALYGDAETRARAFGMLAKIGGWNKAQRVDVRSSAINFHTMIKDGPDSIIGALDAFSHEPGAPVKAGVLGAAKSEPLVDYEPKPVEPRSELHRLPGAEVDEYGGG